MSQAIITKYHGPSKMRGSRVSARAWVGKISIPYDNALNSDQNHANAAKDLAKKSGWSGTWIGGRTPDGSGAWCFVKLSKNSNAPSFSNGESS